MNIEELRDLLSKEIVTVFASELSQEIACNLPNIRSINSESASLLVRTLSDFSEQKDLEKLADLVVLNNVKEIFKSSRLLHRIKSLEVDQVELASRFARNYKKNRASYSSCKKMFYSSFLDIKTFRDCLAENLSKHNRFTNFDFGYGLEECIWKNSEWRIVLKISISGSLAVNLTVRIYVISSQGLDLIAGGIDPFSLWGMPLVGQSLDIESDLSRSLETISLLTNKFCESIISIASQLPTLSLNKIDSQNILFQSEILKLKKDLSYKLFLWSIEDACREIDKGYPILQNIKNGSIVTLLIGNGARDKTSQKNVFSSMIRWRNLNILRQADILTREQLLCLQSWSDFDPMTIENPDNLNVLDRDSIVKFKRNLQEELLGVCGEIYQDEESEWTHNLFLSEFKIVTHFSIDGGFIFGTHHFYEPMLGDFLLLSINILGWLGLDEIYWNIDDLTTIPSIKESCSHFINALPGIAKTLDFTPLRKSVSPPLSQTND